MRRSHLYIVVPFDCLFCGNRVPQGDRLTQADHLLAYIVRNILPCDLAFGLPAQNLRLLAVGLARSHIRLDFEELLAVALRKRDFGVEQCLADQQRHIGELARAALLHRAQFAYGTGDAAGAIRACEEIQTLIDQADTGQARELTVASIKTQIDDLLPRVRQQLATQPAAAQQ